MFVGLKGDWLLRYEARLIKRGLSVEEARDCSNNTEVFWSEEPEDVADDELSYMVQDSE